MQNKINKIIFFGLLILSTLGCNKNHRVDNTFYKYFNYPESDSIILISNIPRKIKDNIFSLNDTLFISIPYFTKMDDGNNKIKTIYLGELLLNTKTAAINIDTTSYSWLVEGLIAKDQNNIFAFPRKYHLPTIKILKLDPSKTFIIDKNNNYLKDEKYIYCIPTDTYLDVDISKFSIIENNGLIYGYDSLFYYYFDKPLNKLQ